MKHLTLILLALAGFGSAFAQDSVYVKFVFHNQAQPFALNEPIVATNGTVYSVTDMAFFASRVELIHDGGQVAQLDTNQVFYINYNAPVANLGQFPGISLEAIRFDVGVPAYLNHLDISQYPEGQPLSFHTPAMHWGWSSGYMFMVMNGLGDNDGDGVPTQGYELNCLGDHNLRTVQVATTATPSPDGQVIVLICNVDEWLRGSDPATTGAAHGDDGINAVVMSNIDDYPVFVSPADASLAEQQQLNVTVAQSGGEVTLTWGGDYVASYLRVDAEGKVLSRGKCEKQQLHFEKDASGWQIVQLFGENGVLMGTAKWIAP